MKIIVSTLAFFSLVAACSANGPELFGLGGGRAAASVTRTTSGEDFGLWSQDVVTDCPGGVCPTCPGGVCPVQPESVVYTRMSRATPIRYETGISVTVSDACPTCPGSISRSAPVTVYRRAPVATAIRSLSPRWTWPGDLAGHLAGPPHYVAQEVLAAMTYPEMVALHDSLHEANGATWRHTRSGRPVLFGRLRGWLRRARW